MLKNSAETDEVFSPSSIHVALAASTRFSFLKGFCWVLIVPIDSIKNSGRYLPLFLIESIGTIRTQQKPLRKEKRVEAARATWMEEGENTSSVSAEFFNIDFYDNQFLLVDKAFTSPLHDIVKGTSKCFVN